MPHGQYTSSISYQTFYFIFYITRVEDQCVYNVEDSVTTCFSAILKVDVFIEWHQCVKFGGFCMSTL